MGNYYAAPLVPVTKAGRLNCLPEKPIAMGDGIIRAHVRRKHEGLAHR